MCVCASAPLPEHWNYLGVDESLGPVAVSLRREKLEEHKDHGQQYNYRVIFRTSEVRRGRGLALCALSDPVVSRNDRVRPATLPFKWHVGTP